MRIGSVKLDTCVSVDIDMMHAALVVVGLIAFSLALMKRDDELKVQPGLFVIVGWG